MTTGAFTGYLDVAQVVLYAFWVFFFGLIYYLRNEDRREGYPLEKHASELVGPSGRPVRSGPPDNRKPKTFTTASGETFSSNRADTREINATASAPWAGAPLVPNGDPMIDGVGPAAYAERADVPDRDLLGGPRIVPLRKAPDIFIESRDPDPRGMTVIAGDRHTAGTVTDVWVDHMEMMIRYLEVETADGEGTRSALVPINFARINGRERSVTVRSIHARHFATVPGLASADQITLLEEDRIMGYYGGGTLYADARRAEPLL